MKQKQMRQMVLKRTTLFSRVLFNNSQLGFCRDA